MRLAKILSLILILVSFILGIFVYPGFPEDVASHWNENGEVDGYMGKFWGVFLMPIITIGLFLLLEFLPKIDPINKNFNNFRFHYDWFILIFVAYMFYVHILTIIWNLGYIFDMGNWVFGGIAFLFIYLGYFLGKVKRNWFAGIRTPWTLSKEEVWDKTHKQASKLVYLVGLIWLLSIFLGDLSIWILLGLFLVVILYLVIYSYVIYKKLK